MSHTAGAVNLQAAFVSNEGDLRDDVEGKFVLVSATIYCIFTFENLNSSL